LETHTRNSTQKVKLEGVDKAKMLKTAGDQIV